MTGCFKKAASNKTSDSLEGVWVREGDTPGMHPADTLRFTSKNGKDILSNIDWTVQPGEHWAVVGLNGSGKTSLLPIVSVIFGEKALTGGKPSGLIERFTSFFLVHNAQGGLDQIGALERICVFVFVTYALKNIFQFPYVARECISA